MLHVALAELAARPRAADARAASRGSAWIERHRVLQLIAEAERAARLIKAGACPHAAGERLVDQPAVGQEIDGRVGRLDIDRAERAAPVVPHAFQRPLGARRRRGIDGRVAGPALRSRAAPRMKTMSFSCPSSRAIGDLHGRAGVEPGAHAAGQPNAPHGRGIRRRAVAAEKLGAVAGDGARRLAAIDKGDPVGELGAVGVAGEERAADRVQLRHHVHQRLARADSPSTHSQ